MLKREDIESIVRQIRAGAQYENPRRELKREFWKLEDNEGKSEFVKDLTAMANTPGPDAYFIIGIDGETGEINNTVLPLDTAKLTDIIYSKLQEPFDCEFYEVEINEEQIVIVHIPQSFNKPHIIKNHKNIQSYIPIRKGTRTNPATRYDLDLMYNERDKNFVPPFKLEIFIGSNVVRINRETDLRFSMFVNLINSGMSLNFLYSSVLSFINEENNETYSGGLYRSKSRALFYYAEGVGLDESYLSIKPDEMIRVNLDFIFPSHLINIIDENIDNGKITSAYISVTDRKATIEHSKNFKFIIT